MRSLILLVFGIVVALSAPGHADQTLGPGRVVDSTNDVLFGPLKIGKKVPGRTELDVSDNIAVPDADAALGTISRRLADMTVFVTDHCSDMSGSTNSQPCLQQAMNAAQAKGRYLVQLPARAGAVYQLGGQVYVPSNVTIDCNGATIRLDPNLTFVNGALWIGGADGVTASTNVRVTRCNFESNLGFNHGAIFLGRGASDVTIDGNTFRASGGYGLAAVTARKRGVRNITFRDNRAYDLRYPAIYLDADETQTWVRCALVPSGGACDQAAHPVPAGTTTFAVPAAIQADIAAGYGYGVMVYRRDNANNTYRLFGAHEGGGDFTYSGGVLTFSTALPTHASAAVHFFTWDAADSPANDLNGLTVEANIARRVRGAAVQINCPVRAYHRRTPGTDCPRNIVVNANTFDGAYQTQGMFNGFNIGSGTSNRLLYSQDFANAAWSRTNVSVVAGVQAPPWDGRASAQKLRETSANGAHALSQNLTLPATGNAVLSCHVRAAGRTRVRLYNTTSAGNGQSALYDLAAGSVVSSVNVGTGTGVAAGLWPEGEGWYRVWLSGALDSASAQPLVYLIGPGDALSYAGDGTSGLDLWGCQLESGRVRPHAYMPTLGNPAGQITTQLISINGVSDFSVTNNVLGPTADQCIHLEDKASNGVVANNTCRGAGGAGIYLTDAQNVVVQGNTVTGSYFACGLLDAYATTSPFIVDAFTTNDTITWRGNTCDFAGVPSATYGWYVGAAGPTPVSFDIGVNPTRNLPAGLSAYTRAGTASPALSGAGAGATLSAGATDLGGEVNSGASATGLVVTFAFKHPSMTCAVTGLSGTAPETVTTTATAVTVTHSATSGARFAYACHEGQ